MAQAHLVGHEEEDAGGPRPLAQPPEPLAEGGAVGRGTLSHYGDRPPSGEDEGGVQGKGAVPAEAERVGDARDGGREPVDGGDGIEALEEEAPPLEGDREGAQQVLHGRSSSRASARRPVAVT